MTLFMNPRKSTTTSSYKPCVANDPTTNVVVGVNHRYKFRGTLKAADRAINEYISAVAHEARNPLTNINLAVEMLKEMPGNQEQKTYLDIIIRASGRISNLVTDLLNSYKADDKKVELLSLHQLLDEVLVITEDRSRLKNITVIKDYTCRDCKLMLNRVNMKIALTNIIINAIEAMTSGNGQLKVTTQFTAGRHSIQIEDNGCGISEENLTKIFQLYFTNKPGGLGVGLATTYAILQANHIGIKVTSKEGVGTTFNLSFAKKYKSSTLSN